MIRPQNGASGRTTVSSFPATAAPPAAPASDRTESSSKPEPHATKSRPLASKATSFGVHNPAARGTVLPATERTEATGTPADKL